MTPDNGPGLTDVAAGGIALAFATGLGLTIGLAAGVAIIAAAWRRFDH